MDAVFVSLGIVDIAAAALIFFPFSEAVMMYIMVYMLVKGGFFLLTGIASRSIGPHCMVLCASDVLVGTALGAIVLGYTDAGTLLSLGTFAGAAGAIGLVKGAYTTLLSMFG